MKSDTQLQNDVLAELTWEPSLNPAQIGVQVKDGIVTLAGQVDSFAEKWDAEHAAQRVAGVKALVIDMNVNLPGSSQREDIDIARSAENVLAWMTYLPQDAVKVMSEHGWVTLSGEVAWEYQREAASTAVRSLLGVTGLSNQIQLRPSVSLAGVKSAIEAALKRQSHSDAQQIVVEISGTDVILSGTVRSLSERELAKKSAWGSPGVHNVIDHLMVS